jgi:hypothetical protein
MKKNSFLSFIMAISILLACGPEPTISTFDAPFPKKNYDLTKVLGNQISLKRVLDTLNLNIKATKNINTFINSRTGDTIFNGKICKYRGLYYFNEELNDGLFWIYAVKIEDSLIYGFDDALVQHLIIDSEIKNGKNRKLIKFINSDTSIIRLHPDKYEMKKLYRSIINQIVPDTIMLNTNNPIAIIESKDAITEIDPEEFDYIKKVYPNPTSDILTVELQQKSKSTYRLSSINGKTILEGLLSEATNKIDLSKQVAGLYVLTIFDTADKQKETIKIVKTH